MAHGTVVAQISKRVVPPWWYFSTRGWGIRFGVEVSKRRIWLFDPPQEHYHQLAIAEMGIRLAQAGAPLTMPEFQGGLSVAPSIRLVRQWKEGGYEPDDLLQQNKSPADANRAYVLDGALASISYTPSYPEAGPQAAGISEWLRWLSVSSSGSVPAAVLELQTEFALCAAVGSDMAGTTPPWPFHKMTRVARLAVDGFAGVALDAALADPTNAEVEFMSGMPCSVCGQPRWFTFIAQDSGSNLPRVCFACAGLDLDIKPGK